MDTTDEIRALCALNRIFGYHPSLGIQLVRQAGSATGVFTCKGLSIPGHPELAREVTPSALVWADEELEKTRSAGFRFLGLSDPAYPPLLKECPDPPLGIYLNGTTPPEILFGERPMVAIVGTRDISSYGKQECQRIVQALSRTLHPPVIVSGLAFGADGIAHATALECGLPTLGVMATGIDSVYPHRHTALAMRMVRTEGCALLTDYPLGTAPVALNFIRRNRIIAGLAQATIVIESRSKGGSLITAKYACDYNRDVYALPGRTEDIRSEGCNSLIHSRMADIITTPEDLADRLGLEPLPRQRKTGFMQLVRKIYGDGSPEAQLAGIVRQERGIDFEGITRRTGWDYGHVVQTAGILESDGFLTVDLLQRCSIQEKNV